jgi:hypothetical protein
MKALDGKKSIEQLGCFHRSWTAAKLSKQCMVGVLVTDVIALEHCTTLELSTRIVGGKFRSFFITGFENPA